MPDDILDSFCWNTEGMTVILAFNNPGSLVVVDNKDIIYLMREDRIVCWGEFPDADVLNIIATSKIVVIHTVTHTLVRYFNQAPRFINQTIASISIVNEDTIAIWTSSNDLLVCKSSGSLETTQHKSSEDIYYWVSLGQLISYRKDTGKLKNFSVDEQNYAEFKRPEKYFNTIEKDLLKKAIEWQTKDNILEYYYTADTLRSHINQRLSSKYSRWIVLNGRTDHWTMNGYEYFACSKDIEKPFLASLYEIYSDFSDFSIAKLTHHAVIETINKFHPRIPLVEKSKITIFRIEGSRLILTDGLAWANGAIYDLRNAMKKYDIDHVYAIYPDIYNHHQVKSNTRIGIDIYEDRTFFSQIYQILPKLYRLGGGHRYEYDLVSENHTVKSYGDGASRHICQKIEEELQKIFKDLNKGLIPVFDPFIVGSTLYILNVEHQIRCVSIHAYFFLIQCCDSRDINDIIRVFKPEMSSTYLEYIKNPASIVRELDDENREVGNDEIRVLEFRLGEHFLASELSNYVKNYYHQIVKGYNYFNHRRSNYGFINRLSPLFYHYFIADDVITRSDLVVKRGNDIQDSSSELYRMVSKTINSMDDVGYLKFRQNITGCSWHRGNITIIFPALEQISPRFRLIDDELSDEDAISDFVDDSEEEIDIEQFETLYDPSLTYVISTCNASLTIVTLPDEAVLKNIFDNVSVTDDYILN
jgi:hypothetical protein